MVHIQALKDLEKAEQVAVTVGHKFSSVFTLSEVQYADVLEVDSPILEKKKRRIQIMSFSNSELQLVFGSIKKIWIKKIKVIVSKEELGRYIFLKTGTIYFKSHDEQHNVIFKACNFFLSNIRDEAYTLNNKDNIELDYFHPKHNLYPHILVILDSKIEFYQVVSTDNFENLSELEINISKDGLSLVSENFDDIVALAKLFFYRTENAERLVGSKLKNSISNEQKKTQAAYSLLQMLCDYIGQHSTSYALNFNINQILFVDCINGEEFIKRLLTDSVDKSGNSAIKATFLRHEKFLHGFNGLDFFTEIDENAWTENYSESTGLVTQACLFQDLKSVQLTLDSLDELVTFCPLVSNPLCYYPDSQDLSKDTPAREYWLSCIAEGVKMGVERMTSTVKSEAAKNLKLYKDLVLERLTYLKTNHQSYGNLSMRLLQDTLENIKREMGLVTMYEKRKKIENETALKTLSNRLKYLDSLNYIELQKELIKSLLAGNMFDWGAKEVAKLLSTGGLNFEQAVHKLPGRPWLNDDLNDWIKRFKEHSYKSVMIFADNSGYDIIIGVLPFVREFIIRGAKVFICVNSEPILNDVTSYELKEIFEEIKSICPILKKGIEEKTLILMEIARSSCCLDLSFIDVKIANVMETIDLLVIEGMGRAIHTNLDAHFKCDSLRVAVIKDHWLSNRLGGQHFACICKFTHGRIE